MQIYEYLMIGEHIGTVVERVECGQRVLVRRELCEPEAERLAPLERQLVRAPLAHAVQRSACASARLCLCLPVAAARRSLHAGQLALQLTCIPHDSTLQGRSRM